MALTGADWAAIISAGANLAGGMMAGHGQDLRNQQNQQFDAATQQRMDQINYLNNLYMRENAANTQGLATTQMDPLAQQRARGNFAIRSALLGGARNASVNLPSGLRGFGGSVSGGIRIPEGGFSPETLAYWSPEAAANAEGQFAKAAAPFVDPIDLSKAGYGAAGTQPTLDAQAARSSYKEQQALRNQQMLDVINKPIVTSAEQEKEDKKKKGPSKKRRFLNGLIGAALGFATGGPVGAVIGGVSGTMKGAGAGAAAGAGTGMAQKYFSGGNSPVTAGGTVPQNFYPTASPLPQGTFVRPATLPSYGGD